MQQYAMHNATIQKTTFFELDVFQYGKTMDMNGYPNILSFFLLLLAVQHLDYVFNIQSVIVVVFCFSCQNNGKFCDILYPSPLKVQ